MKIKNEMRFPHPVLSKNTGDFANSVFEVNYFIREDGTKNQLTLAYKIVLTEPSIREMIDNGIASVGVLVRCNDTYFSSLEKMKLDEGLLDFRQGSLIKKVHLRPLIWMQKNHSNWQSEYFHEEFPDSIDLSRGDILAFDEETIIYVGNAKLAKWESIFEIVSSTEIEDGTFSVSLDEDRIKILAGEKLYETIVDMRSTDKGRAINMGALFTPVVMEVLDNLKAGKAAYAHRRWYEPFEAKCIYHGVDIDNPQLLRDAQKLLGNPWTGIQAIYKEDSGDE